MDSTRRKGPHSTTESGRRGKAPDLDGPLGKQRRDPTATDTQGDPAMPRMSVDPPKCTTSKPPLTRDPAPRTQTCHRGDHRQLSPHREVAAAFPSCPSIHLPGPTWTGAPILGGRALHPHPGPRISWAPTLPAQARLSPVSCKFWKGADRELLQTWERARQGAGKASSFPPPDPRPPSALNRRKVSHARTHECTRACT